MILGFGIDACITIVTLIAVMAALMLTRLRTDLVFLSAIVVLYVTGVLNVTEAFSGFVSTSVLITGSMCIVVAGLSYTGVLQWFSSRVLGQPRKPGQIFLRLTLPVAIMSSFILNKTVVMFFVGVVKMWAKKLSMNPSRLLIPMAYAAGMGGALLIMVTTSGLVVSGLYAEKTGHPLNIFEPLLPALACLIGGMLVVFVLRRLLPDKNSSEAVFKKTNEYTVELLVTSNNPHIGETVGALGLNKVSAGSLVEVIRFDNDRVLSPVEDDEPLIGGDRLIFSGQIEDLVKLAEEMDFVCTAYPVFSVNEEEEVPNFCIAYVCFESSLIGTRFAKISFEKDNQMTLVAVSRQGERIEQPPREVVLRAGDSLLFTSPAHKKIDKAALKHDLHFFDIAEITNKGQSPIVSAAILMAMVILIATGTVPLLQGAFVAAAAMFLFKCCSPAQGMESINWSLLINVAGGITLGAALQKTGVAEQMAMGMLGICGDNPLVVMIAVCLVTAVVTEFISNTATAALMFPIMYNAVVDIQGNLLPFTIALLLSANSAFMTPFSNTPNLMVYGPGGYSATDYLRIGLPVKLTYLTVAIITVVLLYHL